MKSKRGNRKRALAYIAVVAVTVVGWLFWRGREPQDILSGARIVSLPAVDRYADAQLFSCPSPGRAILFDRSIFTFYDIDLLHNRSLAPTKLVPPASAM